MMTASAPIQARPAQRTTTLRQNFGIDPDILPESLALLGEFYLAAGEAQQPPPLQAVKYEYAELASKMVVAHARLAQCGLSRTQANAHRSGAVSDTHDALQKQCHVAVGKSKVPVSPLAFDRNKAGVEELSQVRTDRLLGHRRRLREFRSGQRLARHQRRQNTGARTVTDESRNAHDVRVVIH